MSDSRMRWRRLGPALGVTAVVALVLAACTPEPVTPPPPVTSPPVTSPPATSPPARPECAAAEQSAADGTAITVENATGERKVVAVRRGDDVDAKVRSLQVNGKRVVDVAPEVPVTAAQTDGQVDDPYFDAGGGGGHYGLWGLKRVDAPEAWGTSPLAQGQGVNVAVVDTGVQADHPGLAGRVQPGVDLVVGAPYDGRVDGNGHGTHVAGTVAEIDNGSGGIGVAPQASILPVRVLGCSGGGSSTDVANGIRWAFEHGADVINLSLGTSSPNSTILLAVEDALGAGVVVVAAGGNGGSACVTPTSVSASAAAESTTTTTPAGTLAAPSSTTSSPATAPATDAAPSSTTTTTPAPTTTTSEPEPVALEIVVPAACPSTPYSNPLYPAGFAIGRPGLLAVGATGADAEIRLTSGSGVLHWTLGVGDFFGPSTTVLTVGGVAKSLGFSGVVTQTNLEGATVGAGTLLGHALSADDRASYSNVNDYMTIAAPGGGLPSDDNGIYSTVPGGYAYKSGTSMATPHVAAVAALVLGSCPALTPAQVMSAITSTAEDLGPAGWDAAYGAGMVQADAAVAGAC